jgi:AP-1 complex subunit gamma-1
VIALGLTAIAECSTTIMCRDLYPEVKRLMKSPSGYIRQRATLAAIRTLRNIPDAIEDFLEVLEPLIQDKHQSVVLSVVTLMCEIVRIDGTYAKTFRTHVPGLVRVLKSLLMSGYAPEYEIGGVKDPFLQVKILELLAKIGAGHADTSDEMSDILAQIATNTEQSKNPGNSVLAECAKTIMAIEAT